MLVKISEVFGLTITDKNDIDHIFDNNDIGISRMSCWFSPCGLNAIFHYLWNRNPQGEYTLENICFTWKEYTNNLLFITDFSSFEDYHKYIKDTFGVDLDDFESCEEYFDSNEECKSLDQNVIDNMVNTEEAFVDHLIESNNLKTIKLSKGHRLILLDGEFENG